MLKHFNIIWLTLALAGLCFTLLFSDWLTRDSIAHFITSLGVFSLAGYIFVSLVRAVFLVPCTPFVLAGAISFPQWPEAVFAISLAGVVVGGLLVYCFPSFGGYDSRLEEKYPEQITLLKEKLHGKHAFWIVSGWALFPLVPTDAVCYVAGMVKMPIHKMVTALVAGEVPLVAAYVVLGTGLGEWLIT